MLTNFERQWRYSGWGNYYLHSLSDGSTRALLPPTNPPTVAYAAWAPVGQALAYVSNNDLYVLPEPTYEPAFLMLQAHGTLLQRIDTDPRHREWKWLVLQRCSGLGIRGRGLRRRLRTLVVSGRDEARVPPLRRDRRRRVFLPGLQPLGRLVRGRAVPVARDDEVPEAGVCEPKGGRACVQDGVVL